MNDFFNEIKNILNEDDYKKFVDCYSDKPFRALRVNTLKCSNEKLLSLLGGSLKKTPFCDNGFYVDGESEISGNDPLHHAGAYYIQEPSAMSAVTMLGVKKGDRVLDLCAAPGGKSTQIACALSGEGLLWSNEIVKNRASILLSNIERCGVKNAVVSSCHPDVLCDRLGGYFDKVLVDAPCSGEGMFRKDKDAYLQWSREHVLSCSKRQLQILNSAKNALRDGGVLVYSTCTFSYEENEGVINEFLRENPEFSIEDSGEAFGRNTLKYAKRIFPFDGGEGHFAVRLKKGGKVEANDISRFAKPKTADLKFQKQYANIFDFYDDNFINRPFGSDLQIINDRVFLLPENLPDTKGLGVLRAGVMLGEVKTNRVEPAHSAYMACKSDECKNAVDFDCKNEEDYKTLLKFLHGEEIRLSDNIKGYAAVCVNGITVGFGKASNGVLKNKYPKGLRIL